MMCTNHWFGPGKMRSFVGLLTSIGVLLLLLGQSVAMAPGDEDKKCQVPEYPSVRVKVLMDSWRYQTLLGEDGDSVWSANTTEKQQMMVYSSSYYLTRTVIIRASVDALCRDGTGQISRDPRKNCLKTRRECLTRPSKLTKSHSRASIQLSTCRKASYVAPMLCARIRSHAISQILVIIIIIIIILPLLQ